MKQRASTFVYFGLRVTRREPGERRGKGSTSLSFCCFWPRNGCNSSTIISLKSLCVAVVERGPWLLRFRFSSASGARACATYAVLCQNSCQVSDNLTLSLRIGTVIQLQVSSHSLASHIGSSVQRSRKAIDHRSTAFWSNLGVSLSCRSRDILRAS